MLEGLNSVDWGRLTDAYGEAADVPSLIGALSSNDQEERREALGAELAACTILSACPRTTRRSDGKLSGSCSATSGIRGLSTRPRSPLSLFARGARL
jgi:hypothetical protein